MWGKSTAAGGIIMINSVTAAPRLPAGNSQPRHYPAPETASTPRQTPRRSYPQHFRACHRVSGQSLNNTAATASMTPANSAAIIRGQRQGLNPRATPRSPTSSRAHHDQRQRHHHSHQQQHAAREGKRQTCWRSAATRSLTFISGALMLVNAATATVAAAHRSTQ